MTAELSTTTNRSLVLRAIKDIVLDKVPVPELTDPYDVIVEIGQTGICGYETNP